MKGLVVGGGSIGARHLRNLENLGVPCLALVEPDEQRRMELHGAVSHIAAFTVLEEGLDWGPDFVVVASPTHLHTAQALAAARYGCAIFIEKPISYVLDGLAELCSVVDERKLTTMVGCNMRFHPGPATVKRLLDQGTVGTPIAARIQTGSYLLAWRPGQDHRNSYSASPVWGGAVLDCVHEIDLALWYFGPATVVGAARLRATSIGLEADGLAEMILRHESGVLCNVHLNFMQRDYRRTCQVIGSEGTIYWDFAERLVRVYGPNGQLAQSYGEPDGWQVNQMYVDEMRYFLGAVQDGVPTSNPVEGGVAVLKVALTARQMPAEGWT